MNSEKKTKLCKEYISQIKCFFPVIRQNEKKYINYISTSVNIMAKVVIIVIIFFMILTPCNLFVVKLFN